MTTIYEECIDRLLLHFAEYIIQRRNIVLSLISILLYLILVLCTTTMFKKELKKIHPLNLEPLKMVFIHIL